ncbi:MAG TPA: hypothetical protein VH352_24695 [Pseudonocardiaceae bacterium]|nr:hypothetical protein [Pseudonocardiaceae bacterium]
MSLVAAPAFAATTTHVTPHDGPGIGSPWGGGDDSSVSFPEAYHTFIWGGGALGAGAAALVAGAYAGIAATPADILGTLEHHHHG